MKAPNKFIDLINKEKLEEVESWLRKYGDDDSNIENIRIVNEPKGDYQGEGEYCLQRELATEIGIYAFEGTYYHQIKDSDKFVAFDYFMFD